jgi:hypothetical protein
MHIRKYLNMEFLQQIENRGYPTDYLVSRIHGRRVYLFSDWDTVLFSPDINEHLMQRRYGEFIPMYSTEGIWHCYRKELHWIYHQMNNRLRDIFHPYFIYSELGTLMTGLRFKLGEGSKAEIDHLLSYSLLTEHIKDALRAETDIPSSLQVIERSLELPSGNSPDLQDIYTKNGLQKTEEVLKRVVFKNMASLQMHHLMKSFFAALVNTVNLLALYKHLKWGITAELTFIDGGSIHMDSFHRVIASRKIDEIVHLIYKQTGISLEELDLPRLESMLNSYLIQQTKRMEREGSDIGFILNYLWRCYTEAGNLTIISYGKKIDKTIIKRELAY